MFCRICTSVVDAKHSLAFFSTLSMSLGWPTRIRELLRVDIASLAQHICRSCKGKIVSLEEKLEKLRALAQASLKRLQEMRDGRKRPKQTSGSVGVSPHTVSERPPEKRPYGRTHAVARRLLIYATDGRSHTGNKKQ